MFQIVCNHGQCIRCDRCVMVCPAHRLPNDEATDTQLTGARAVFLAHAKDENVRWMGSSGGVARALLHHLLATRQVDAAYSLVYPEPMADGLSQYPLTNATHTPVQPTGQEAVGQWLTAPPPMPRIPASLYRPLPWGQGLANVDQNWKRVLLIGLPCQLKGAKALLAILAPDLEMWAVAIFCRQQKKLSYTRLVQRMLGCPHISPSLISYRGRGWEGQAGTQDQLIPYLATTEPAFSKHLWRIPACPTCPDCLAAATADLTLADPWGLRTGKTDPLGSNLVFVWTPAGATLFAQASTTIQMYSATVEEARRSIGINAIAAKAQEVRFYLGQERARWRRIRCQFEHCHQQWLETCLSFTTPQSRLWRASGQMRRLLRRGLRLPTRVVRHLLRR